MYDVHRMSGIFLNSSNLKFVVYKFTEGNKFCVTFEYNLFHLYKVYIICMYGLRYLYTFCKNCIRLASFVYVHFVWFIYTECIICSNQYESVVTSVHHIVVVSAVSQCHQCLNIAGSAENFSFRQVEWHSVVALSWLSHRDIVLYIVIIC